MIHHGNCLDVLRTLEAESCDALVTDPPAGISFMGKGWDDDKGGRNKWIAWLTEVMVDAMRVLRPGAHGLVWALPRTSHWTGTALEEAGFDVRDCITHLFGTGFPKSLDVSKAIDKAAGVEREVVGTGSERCKYIARGEPCRGHGDGGQSQSGATVHVAATAPATGAAKAWDGWGTALKPAAEMWWLVRKPFQGTVATNVLEHGTGALNIDGCRVAGVVATGGGGRRPGGFGDVGANTGDGEPNGESHPAGRWPPNVVLDDAAAAMLDEQSGERPGMSGGGTHRHDYGGGMFGAIDSAHTARADTGGASRFFPRFRYCPKASTAERELGLEGAERASGATVNTPTASGTGTTTAARANDHPTVKPRDLMRWLVRLITPPGGVVLDPFAGSGSTGVACALEGVRFIGIEIDEHYSEIARARIAAAKGETPRPIGSPLPRREVAPPPQLGLFDPHDDDD